MALVLKDRVKETTTSTGTGTINLAGAASGFQTFVAGVGSTNTTYYAIEDANGTAWEVGLGTVTDASPDTLSRTIILDNSNGDTDPITLSTGTHTVFGTYPAGKAVYLDATGVLSHAVTLTADVTGTLPAANGGTGLTSTSTLLNSNVTPTSLSLVIGTDVQGYDADLSAIAALSSADGNFIVGSPSGWVAESGATARASLGVDATGTDNSTNVTLVTTSHDYLSISTQAITLGIIDISDDTNLVAGTGITLTGDTLSVDASQTQVTAVGTIATGTWQGTAIAQAYIANDAINGDKIADDVVDSEHYVAGSIDEEHLNVTNSPTDNYILSYDSASGGFTWVASGGGGEANEYSFKTISVSGQDDVVADTTTDTLTLAAGSNVTITTTTASDTVTIAATDSNSMGSGFTVSATTDTTATTITQGDDLFCAAGTGITCETTADGTVTISSTVTDTNTQLTQEQVEDYVGGMVAGNTETGIAVTYEDGDGTLDFVVSDTTVAGDSGSTGITPGDTLTIAGGTNVTTAMSGDTLTITATDTNTMGSGFTVSATTDSNATTITQGDDLMFAAGTGITCETTADGTVTIACTVTDTNTQLTTEAVQDIVGGMVTGNTETGIAVTYEDGDGTLDFVVGTLNQDTTGNAATATALETARTINGTSFDGTANITITAAGSTLSDTVTVAKGGTGATSLTDGGILLGSGTGAITATAVLANGELLIGDNSTDPTVATLTAGSNVTITNGAGSITIASTDTNTQLTTEQVQDIVGGMVTGNTETGIAVTYEDGDGTLDFVVGTLNQDTTGNAATATALETARTINGTSFDGTANITITAAGSTLSDTVTVAKGGTGATSLTDGGVLLGSGTDAITATAVLGNGELLIGDNSTDPAVATLTAGSNVTITNGAGTITIAAANDNTQLSNEQVQDIVGGMVTGNTETGISVTYEDGDGTLDFVVGTLNQDTTGNAATATALETARTINGTSFDGTANITVTAAGSTLSDTVTVAKGGTGATTLTDGGILLGSGTGAVTAMSVLGDGVIVVGDNSTDPTTITAFTASDGVLKHEVGGLELDISAIAIGDVIAGTGTGSVGIVTSTGHNDGDVLTLQADGTADWEAASGGIDGSGAAGYVAIWSDADTLTYDNNQLYWDSSNNELGIGTATPASTLHVAGTVSLQPYTISSSSGEGDTDWDTIGANTKEIGAIAATTYLIETGNTDRTIELPDPASTLVGRTYTIKKTDSGTGKVVIQPYSSGSAPAGGYIDGDNQTTGKGGDTLYCQYDVITATCAEGTTSDQYEWHIVEEKVRAHTARVEQTSAQSINDDVVTQITFDADDFEFGADADHANDKIIIKRAGVYHITGFYSMTSVVGAGNYIKAKIGVTPSGGSVAYHAESSSRTMDPISAYRYKPATVTSVTLELDVDDEITLYGLHTDAGHENTRSATDNEGRCFLEVKEIR